MQKVSERIWDFHRALESWRKFREPAVGPCPLVFLYSIRKKKKKADLCPAPCPVPNLVDSVVLERRLEFTPKQ